METTTNISTNKNKIIWLFFFLILICIALTFLFSSLYYNSRLEKYKTQIALLEENNNNSLRKLSTLESELSALKSELSQPKTNSEIPTTEKYTFPKQDKIIAPNNDSLYYQVNNTKQAVDVYLEIDNHKNVRKLINDVPIGIAGGSMPEFLPTSNPSITLLTIGDADMGWRYKNYYYIDTEDRNVYTVKTNNQARIGLVDKKGVKTTIGTNIENECYDGNKCKNSGTTSLDDLTVNDEKAGILKEAKILSCFNPDGLGGCYKEDVQFEYLGISTDLGKVYFSFTGKKWEEGESTTLWQENYCFDIQNQVIEKEGPNNLLE